MASSARRSASAFCRGLLGRLLLGGGLLGLRLLLRLGGLLGGLLRGGGLGGLGGGLVGRVLLDSACGMMRARSASPASAVPCSVSAAVRPALLSGGLAASGSGSGSSASSAKDRADVSAMVGHRDGDRRLALRGGHAARADGGDDTDAENRGAAGESAAALLGDAVPAANGTDGLLGGIPFLPGALVVLL